MSGFKVRVLGHRQEARKRFCSSYASITLPELQQALLHTPKLLELSGALGAPAAVLTSSLFSVFRIRV